MTRFPSLPIAILAVRFITEARAGPPSIGRFSVMCDGHNGADSRCVSLGPDRDTIDDARGAALAAGWEQRGDIHYRCHACKERAALVGDGTLETHDAAGRETD